MPFDPRERVSDDIEDACRRYAAGTIDEQELEAAIEQAYRMEYTYEELQQELGSLSFQTMDINASERERELVFMGMSVEPGESVRLDELFDPPEPFELDIDPWDTSG